MDTQKLIMMKGLPVYILQILVVVSFSIYTYYDTRPDVEYYSYWLFVYSIVFPIGVSIRASSMAMDNDSDSRIVSSFILLVKGQKKELNKLQLYAVYVALSFLVLSSFWMLFILVLE